MMGGRADLIGVDAMARQVVMD